MKIAVSQLSSFPGKLASNLEKHILFIRRAADEEANVILFPELSLSGYEPTLADHIALALDDPFFDSLDNASRTYGITIIAGAPLSNRNGVTISALIFRPDGQRAVYSKRHLHTDELPYFVRGVGTPHFPINGQCIGISICYELSVDDQNKEIIDGGAEVYLASVAKFERGISPALEQLASISRRHNIPVCLSNAVGAADGDICAGKSSVWDGQGNCIGQMGEDDEGLILFDNKTGASSIVHILIKEII